MPIQNAEEWNDFDEWWNRYRRPSYPKGRDPDEADGWIITHAGRARMDGRDRRDGDEDHENGNGTHGSDSPNSAITSSLRTPVVHVDPERERTPRQTNRAAALARFAEALRSG